VRHIRQLLDTGAPVDASFLAHVAGAVGVPVALLGGFESQPLRRLYHRAVCGGVILSLGGTIGAPRAAEVPMAFQSALAGVLLAAEVVIDATALRGARATSVPARTEADLLRPLGRHLSSPEQKHPSGKCLCQDADYRNAFRLKYAVGCASAPSGVTH
jgi:hypothetical protein